MCLWLCQWPGVSGHVRPANDSLKLYGGAAFERCIDEFQQAVRLLEFPPIPTDKVANILLAQSGRGTASAAEGIARAAAKELLAPLLEIACARLAAVLRKVFDMAAEQAQLVASASRADNLRPYVAFHAALRSSYHSFIGGLEDNAKVMSASHCSPKLQRFYRPLHGYHLNGLLWIFFLPLSRW